MRMRYWSVLSLLGATWAISSAAANEVQVTEFAPYTATPTAGVWTVTDNRTGTTGSTASIVPAPSVVPLGNDAGLLTTNSTNASMAQVGVANNYGLISSILDDINLSYSYWAHNTAPRDTDAPAIKLTFLNPTYVPTGGGDKDRGYAVLVYEPYWNQPGHEGTSNPIPQDSWQSVFIDADHGLFWTTGGFNKPNGAGGPPLLTLRDWYSAFNSQFSGGASLVSVDIGLGSYQPGATGYFDKVVINGTAMPDVTYNFETPEPSSAVLLFGSGLAVGLFSLARKRRGQAVA